MIGAKESNKYIYICIKFECVRKKVVRACCVLATSCVLFFFRHADSKRGLKGWQRAAYVESTAPSLLTLPLVWVSDMIIYIYKFYIKISLDYKVKSMYPTINLLRLNIFASYILITKS